jgi:putative chitinase
VATKYPILSASWFFSRCLTKCDGGSSRTVVESVTKCVNGGLIGIEERYKHFVEYFNLLS